MSAATAIAGSVFITRFQEVQDTEPSAEQKVDEVKDQDPAAEQKTNEAAGAEVAAVSDEPLAGYLTFTAMEAELQALAQSELADLKSLGKTVQDRDIWLLTLSKDQATTRPAILMVGNVYGPHLLGRELAVRLAKSILETHGGEGEGAKDLLNQFTIYVIPSPTPDATEKNFAKPYREQSGNSIQTDDDRDFSVGEDGPVDLNDDGWITMLRVAEPFGTHRAHDKDPRVMVPIDTAKAETGTHRIYVEARDADGDKQFGEDGAEGVDFNRNFTFNYPYFEKGAGAHQVSEVETRVIADFVFDHPNIGAILCFSPEDNLIHPWKGSSATDGARIKTKILTKDQAYTDRLATKFKELGANADVPAPPTGAGSFSEWAYFHAGRWSFASRGWGIPKKSEAANPKDSEEKKETADDAQPADAAGGDAQPTAAAAVAPAADRPPGAPAGGRPQAGRGGAGGPGGGGGPPGAGAPRPSPTGAPAAVAAGSANTSAADLAALAWFEQNKIAGFVDWQPFVHPDFKGKQVEIGGFKPFYRLNPPAALIDGLVKPHAELLVELSRLWPRIEITEVEAKKVGPGIYDVRCKIVNAGEMPTMPLMGELSRQAYPIMVELVGADEVRWLKGSRRVPVSRLEARGGSQEITWLLQVTSAADVEPEFKIRAVAPTLQTVEQAIEWSAELPADRP